MHIKNSILVLTKIAPFFPIKHVVGEKLEAAVAELVVAEKREDLKIFVQGLVSISVSITSCRLLTRDYCKPDTRLSSLRDVKPGLICRANLK